MSDEPQDVSLHHLLPGIGVVIDDQIDVPEGGDAVHNLVAQLEQRAIPLVKYSVLPNDKILASLGNVSFIILDWEMLGDPGSGVKEVGMASIGDALENENQRQIIAFLNKLKAFCFAPVFILSNEDTAYINGILNKEGILQSPSPGAHIFVEAKTGLKTADPSVDESPLLKKLSEWISSTPSLYLIAEWRRRMDLAQTSLFWDLFEASPGWPKALWKASKEDGDDPDYALCEILIRSIRGQIEPLGLNEELVIGKNVPDAGQKELRAILERTTAIPNSRLPAEKYGCGDIFRGQADGVVCYYLNIRCDCDCVVRGDEGSVELYVLKGEIVPEDQLKPRAGIFSEKTGFARPMNRAFVFPVDNGKCVAIKFADLVPITVKEIRDRGIERIARLTSPHLTDIRHRYSNWLHREGFPKIPTLAVNGP